MPQTVASVELKMMGVHLTGYLLSDNSVSFLMKGKMRHFATLTEAVQWWLDNN